MMSLPFVDRFVDFKLPTFDEFNLAIKRFNKQNRQTEKRSEIA
jgi:hypothetical protein